MQRCRRRRSNSPKIHLQALNYAIRMCEILSVGVNDVKKLKSIKDKKWLKKR
jgi:hypothetical protein